MVDTARKQGKLLRASVAIQGGEIPHECNLKCRFCFTEGGSRNRGQSEITNEDALRFLYDASGHALDSDAMNYFFVSEGEPTLNNEFPNILQETSKLGGTMTVFTNLLKLTGEHIEAFKRHKNLFVCGKMYGITPETNDNLTGVMGSFARMMKNIDLLIQEGLAREGRLGVQCVITQRNYDEIVQLFRYCRNIGIVPHFMMYRPQGNWAQDQELDVPYAKLQPLYEELARIDKEEFGYVWTPRPPMVGLGDCYVPGVNLYLVRNGDYTICAGDSRKVGNVWEHSIEEVMNHPVFIQVREHFKQCPWLKELME